MSTERDFARIAGAWMAEGPTELADRVFAATLDEVHRTRQRRSWLSSRRRNRTATARLAAMVVGAALLIVLLALGSGVGTSPRPTGPLTPPSIAPTPTLSSSAPALIAPLGYPGGGTIAFTRAVPAPGTGTATWMIDPDGAREMLFQHTTDLTTGAGCCVLFSPDGSRAALGYVERDPSRGPGDLETAAILRLDGTLDEAIPDVCAGCGSGAGIRYVPRAWSPDGLVVALEVWSESDSTRNGINLSTPGGAWQVQVTGAHRDVPLAFSPDGGRLLFLRHDGSPDGVLWLLTLDTGEVRQVSPDGALVLSDDYLGPGASWSPDGRRIAYAASDETGSNGQMRVFVVDAAGGSPVPITPVSAYSTSAAWSSDGNWIASDRDVGNGHHHVFVAHPDGTGERDLMADYPHGACCPHWSPDGTAVVAPGTATTDDFGVLLILPLDGSGPRQVTTVPALYQDVAWGAATR